MSPRIEPSALQAALERLRNGPSDRDLRLTLELVCEATVELFDVAGAGLMTIDDGRVLRYIVATDDPSRALERVQEETGEGPCVEALVRDVVVRTSDVSADDRWPAAAAALRDTPVRAVLGLPVHIGGGAVGSLNVYRQEAYEWDHSEVGALLAFNGLVEHLLASALAADARDEVVGQLQHALDHRVQIERAVGVLMGRHQLDAVAAFNRLRAQARAERRSAATVAEEILSEFC